jgi:cytochrome c peroxidase
MTRVLTIAGLTVWLCCACGDDVSTEADTPTSASMMSPDEVIAALRARAATSFSAIDAPEIPDDKRELFDLGRRLFFEPRLSADGQVSCGTCHLTKFGGGDGLAFSLGVFNRKNSRNAPTVFNAVLQSSQRWRGDRASLADQAAESPLGMASLGNADEAEALGRLRDAGYTDAFEQAFAATNEALSLANLGTAIAAFEETLLTPSRFDAFLKGNDDALDARERRGLTIFMDSGCADCHGGAGLGGQQLTKFGVLAPYEQATGSAPVDQGRFDVTHDEADRFVFKVPMLRNVASTAPYFHDGSAIGLDQAVRVMLEVQVGKALAEYELDDMVAFLRTLSGPAPAWYSPPD